MAGEYYETLGVAKHAGEEEIKKAYRRLARECHPDANPHDPHAERKFKDLGEAFSTLSDPERRRQYDMFGTAGQTGINFDPFDIFSSFFGGSFGGDGRGRSGGEDLVLGLEITLEEVVKGAKKQVSIRRKAPCETCAGSGAHPGTSAADCATCAGAGAVRSVSRSIFGNVMSTHTCPACRGAGQQIDDPCRECRGEGRIEGPAKVDIEVPAGIEDGMQLRLSGRGQAGPRGAEAGDLYVQMSVTPADGLAREGNNLIATLNLPFTQSVLGARVKIGTFDGPVELEIPQAAQPGHILKIRGKGIPNLKRPGRGDLLVKLGIEVPSDLSAEEEDLLRRFAELRGDDIAEPRNFMDRLRGAFRP
ncbi:MAG: molecular chaperone DnaJ [Actinomycetota bacterium]